MYTQEYLSHEVRVEEISSFKSYACYVLKCNLQNIYRERCYKKLTKWGMKLEDRRDYLLKYDPLDDLSIDILNKEIRFICKYIVAYSRRPEHCMRKTMRQITEKQRIKNEIEE